MHRLFLQKHGTENVGLMIPYPVLTGKHFPLPEKIFPPATRRKAALRLTSPIRYATFPGIDFQIMRSEKVSSIAAGKYLPNRMLFFFHQALEATIGRSATVLLWQNSGPREECLSSVTDDLEKAVEFSCYSSLCASIGQVYGESGARTILHQCGRTTLSETLRSTAALGGLDGTRLFGQTSTSRIVEGMQSVIRLLGLLSDMECCMEIVPQGYRFRVTACPECAGRRSDGKVCHSVGGMLRGVLDWFGIDPAIPVIEDECLACGDAGCVFFISGAF
jgi:predicted hydrocarbon binding protein